MPLVRETPNKNPSYRTFSSKQTPRTENTPQPRLSSSAQKTVNTISKNNDDKGASKYVMAVNMAKERFADDPDVNKTIFRNTVDDIYDSMKEEGDKSAADLRGENPLQQFGRGVGQFFDTINNAIGYGLDTAFDATIGNLIDGISGGTAGAKDWFDAEDMAFIPDLAEDIGLSLIPYAGIPLAMAKNAAQRTDEISEALTGRDSVTQEKLNGWEQGGRVADALLGVGLAAVPGIGKAAASKALPKMAGKADTEAVRQAIKNSDKIAGLDDALKLEGKDRKAFLKAVNSAGKELKSGKAKPAAEAVKEGAEGAAKETAETSQGPISRAIESIRSLPTNVKTALDTHPALDKVAESSGNILFSPVRLASQVAPNLATMATSATAAYGEDPLTSLGQMMTDEAMTDNNFWANPAGLALLLGSRKLTNKAIGKVNPDFTRYQNAARIVNNGRRAMRLPNHLLSDAPYQSARAAAAGNLYNQINADQLVDDDAIDYNELVARLQAAGGQR